MDTGGGNTATLHLSNEYANILDKALIPYMFNKPATQPDARLGGSEFANFTEEDWKDFFEIKKTDNTE